MAVRIYLVREGAFSVGRTTHELAQETVSPDEGLVVTEFIAFLKATSEKHHPTGVVPRFNQGRAAG